MHIDILCPETVLVELTSSQREVYQRLNDYDFDRPDSPLPFSRRLSQEHRWSRDFTDRAMREYKRFAFLAVVAEHPVSPSDQVDQVWHLHLTYTRSYWQEFCDDILGMPLHHEPTKGGASERAKHDDWYRKTLESYTRIFGHTPPTDLWPPSEIRFGRDNHFARINTQQHWILPKPQAPQAMRFPNLQWKCLPRLNLRALVMVCGCLGLSSLLASCQASDGSLNPLDMRGPDFLAFYLWLNLILVGVGLVLRQWLRPADRGTVNLVSTLDPYETAYLAGGNERLMQTVITRLALEEHIKLNPDRSLAVNQPLPIDAPTIERNVFDAISSNGRLGVLRSKMKSVAQTVHDRLVEQGLIINAAQSHKMRLYPTLLILLSVGLGCMKIWVGLSRGRPVGFLVVSCVVLAIVASFFYAAPPHRTKNGDRLFQKLKQSARSDRAEPSGNELVMAVALVGAASLLTSDLAGFHQYFVPPKASASSGSSAGCSSGCGSSCSSGCGSSCGGGCGGCSG